jgi:two-component system chemotaxis sensor kinase CheA
MIDEALKEFLVESHENLDQLDRDFVVLETNPADQARIGAVFRTIHTIKGTAGFFDFSKLEALTHAGESLLSQLRDGTRALTPETTSVLLAMVDRVRAMLRSIEEGAGEGRAAHEDVLARFEELDLGTTAKTSAKVVSAPKVSARPPVPTAKPRASSDLDQSPTGAASVSDGNIRVDIGLLDKLMNLVGELVLARNQIVQFGARFEDNAFCGASQRLDLITTELQEHVMKTRMQPIGNVWNKLPRVVRDLAVSCGKQVHIEMRGKETELDRTVLEAIKDPLVHIVRNSVDHGIETGEVRARHGKPRTGTLLLRAYHEGGQVNIEISDDGAGLDLDAVRKRAIERGPMLPERLARLSDRELMQLVFMPGFSTAVNVTNVSGRGVGMDVVKTNIERIGGTVDISSTHGVGTTIKIKIPLTLAIVPALVVASSGQRYAIPQVSLLELVRLEGDRARDAIERIHGTPVYRLRGRLLPIVFLNEQLGSRGDARRGVFAGDAGATNIVVLQAGDRQFGLVVDDVKDTEEIVVKPLGKELKGISVFAGATIMGDGRVALILDVMGLAQHVGVASTAREQSRLDASKPSAASGQPAGDEKQALLLFGVGADGTMALPLSMIARLEEFPREQLERSGKRHVVQYRNEILWLVDLSEFVGDGPNDARTPIHVIVYSEGNRSVGFVVTRILDVVEEAVRIERRSAQRGVLGAAVIQGKVTDILDVHGVIRAHDPSFFDARAS